MCLARLYRNFLVAQLTISVIYIVNFSVINKQWYAYSYSSSRIHKQSIPLHSQDNYLRRKYVVALNSQLQSDEETPEGNNQYNTLPRLFVGNLQNSFTTSEKSVSSKLNMKSRIKLSPDQTHYLTKVMRIFSKKKLNENNEALIRVFDGIDGEWLCRLQQGNPMSAGNESQDGKKKRRQRNSRSRSDTVLEAECLAQLRPQTENENNPNNSQSPWLFFAPIKKQRAKIMVEKCTELGVGVFCPIITTFTDSASLANIIPADTSTPDAVMFQDLKANSKSNNDVDKLSMVACEAAEQCERLNVPSFVTTIEKKDGGGNTEIMSVKELLEAWTLPTSQIGKDRVLMICRERTDDRPTVFPVNVAMQKAFTLGNAKNVAFLVGPEGGWSPEEEIDFDRYCEDHPEDIMGISLGSNVLRAETASILAVGSHSLWSISGQI